MSSDEKAKYFTDTAIRLGEFGASLNQFHLTIVVAALGWAISSRSWSRGLPNWVCAVAALALMGVGLLDELTARGIYARINFLLSAAQSLWTEGPYKAKLDGLYKPWGSGQYPLLAIVFLDGLAALIMALTLSKIGRDTSKETN